MTILKRFSNEIASKLLVTNGYQPSNETLRYKTFRIRRNAQESSSSEQLQSGGLEGIFKRELLSKNSGFDRSLILDHDNDHDNYQARTARSSWVAQPRLPAQTNLNFYPITLFVFLQDSLFDKSFYSNRLVS